jgi:hypothetical protein
LQHARGSLAHFQFQPEGLAVRACALREFIQFMAVQCLEQGASADIIRESEELLQRAIEESHPSVGAEDQQAFRHAIEDRRLPGPLLFQFLENALSLVLVFLADAMEIKAGPTESRPPPEVGDQK